MTDLHFPSSHASALPAPAKAVAPGQDGDARARITAACAADLDAILQIEQASYPEPWSRASFADILARQGTACGDYVVQLLWARQPSGADVLQGYFVAMLGFEEMHLLNLAVRPDCRAQGCAHVLLQHLRNWAQWYGAQALWLEVRQSNARAQAVYRRFGFMPVATRAQYYPAPNGQREDAIVMQLMLGGESARP